MDIGSGYSLSACSLAQDVSYSGPQPLAPLAGILDAQKVIIIGASITEAAFETDNVVNANIAAHAAALGFTGTVVSYAQSGDRIAQGIDQAAAAKADHAASEGSNLYIAHIGGNNVSAHRPYPGGEPEFTNQYTTLLSNITATDKIVPLPLTKRLYGIDEAGYPANPNDVDNTDPNTDQYGSLPYNENAIYPLIDTYAPDWRAAGQVPYVDPYGFIERNPDLLTADGVHGAGHAFARYVLSKVAARALGQGAQDSRAGKTLMYRFSVGAAPTTTIAPINNIIAYANGTGYPVFTGAQFLDGSVDGHSVLRVGSFNNGGNGAGADAFARIADSRFHDVDMLSKYIYVQGSNVARITIGGLAVGDTVTATAVAGHSAAWDARLGDLTLNEGEVLTLNPQSDAASNQVVFQPVTVPASGEITFDLAVSAGATYGLLSGLGLDFS
ncbi:SGNH/GDSL hydrolase family protein [Litorivita sp. NS0012-18]|uniref:SGNH/GDSL hydrolase family protein n=1 Tax=Litorivita sp. NS0012-18 TaxID=3127655 RepID=UPI003103714E